MPIAAFRLQAAEFFICRLAAFSSMPIPEVANDAG
jgi:hypothetical protein